VDRLAGAQSSARRLLEAISAGQIAKEEIDEYTLEKLAAVLLDEPALAEIRRAARSHPVLRLEGRNDDFVDTPVDLTGAFTVETWIKLDPGINNNDGILAAPGQADFNFHDARFRVWDAEHQDVIIAKQPVLPDVWTHFAVTRGSKGEFKIYQNGELDNDQSKPSQRPYRNLAIGRTLPNGGTAGMLTEFRIWNVERSAGQIRENYKTSLTGEPRPEGLTHYQSGSDWGKLHGAARVLRMTDFPPLLTAAEARELNAKVATYRQMAERPGDPAPGQSVFKAACLVCHNVQGEGGTIAPSLNGAGLRGTEELLRALLTPNAAVESGYYRYRVELTDGEVVDGFLAAQDETTLVLRQPNSSDLRIPRSKVKRAAFTRTSMMPEGLLEALQPQEIANLFAYLRTVK